MALASGTRLGPYEILSPLGVGGMGEVYRARDGTLQRDVALKILPESVATDPDRLARFRREAQVLASLNHPHIGAIYGFEESTGVHALVLELIEGPTLADRIAQGAIPVDEALPIARQIAEALEAAHEQGIIHRDLKPANIKLRPDGTVKVLDFGLAKLASASPTTGGASASLSPTITSPAMMTGIGVLLGTAAYMSPEQAKGREADKRSDLWAFGCVLYEMLTGRRALGGDDVADTLAAVLRQDIDWTALPHSTPSTVRTLLRRCLERDTRRRLRDVGEARIVLNDPATFSGDAGASAAPIPRRSHPLITLIVALTAAAVAGGLVWFATRSVPPRVSALMITPEAEDAASISLNQLDLAVLPDGSGIVYVGRGGTTLLFRRLDTLTPRVLFVGMPHGPFVSADSNWVGFVDGRTELKKVPIAGGPAVTVAQVDGLPRGATWTPDGGLIYATSGLTSGLLQISAEGGPATVLTTPDRDKGERAHTWPDMLPGGHSVLFTITTLTGGLESAQVVVQDLQTHTRKVLLAGASGARYVASGHLLYASKGTMMAVPFDLSGLTRYGTPVALVPEIVTTRTGGMYGAVAGDGTLAYLPAGGGAVAGPRRSMLWVDRAGGEARIPTEPRAFTYPHLSSDGTRAVFGTNDQERDIWIADLERGYQTKVGGNPANENYALWMPDGRIIFASDRSGVPNLWIAAEGSANTPERLTNSANPQYPSSITTDGRLIFTESSVTTGGDVLQMELDSTHRITTLLNTPADERNGVVSPDRHWLAYQSDESGDVEVFVRKYPQVAERVWPVSKGGGTRPLWSRDGKELFYVSASGAIMRVAVMTGRDWNATPPVQVVKEGYYTQSDVEVGRLYDVDKKGNRFLVLERDSIGDPVSFVIVQNWVEELKRLVPVP